MLDPVVFRLRVFLGVMVGVAVLSTVGFIFVEHLSVGDAIYFSIVTIATVGYGDIHPATPVGKVLTVFLIIGGVGTFTGLVANGTEFLLASHEKQRRMQKLNLVIGLFFSEVGTELLARFVRADPEQEMLRNEFEIREKWSEADMRAAFQTLGGHPFKVDGAKAEWTELREFLQDQKTLLLRLLEHPNILEHEAFTDLLRAVFHLREELVHRKKIQNPSETDIAHLAFDVSRVYGLLVRQWLDYMRHLKVHYPYLFSLAMRRNPFLGAEGADLA